MRLWISCYLLLFAVVALVAHEWTRIPDGKLHIAFLDIGQGDSVLITTPGNQRIIVDGGPNWSLLERLGEELPFFRRSIDLLILSHSDADHISALPEVLYRYDIKKILLTGIARDTAIYSAFLEAARESGAEILLAEAGNDLSLGEGVMLDILWPLGSLFGEEPKVPNNTSIVVKLTWKDHPTSSTSGGLRGASVLFTGDIEEEVEEALLKEGMDLRSDILKVAHHGSKTSSSTGFLLAVAPTLAVISVGAENTYGHPHPSVLTRLEMFGIPVRRTDEEGSIHLVLD
jgi:competence protein ComEC